MTTKGKPSEAYEEFQFKTQDAETRLGSEFLAFVKATPARSYFVFGGNGASEFFQGPTFGVRIIAASNRELRETENLLKRLQEETASAYAPIDFYASVASQMTASYLEEVMQNENIPQATAVAAMFFDMFGNLTVVEFSGDYETYSLPESGQMALLAGAYDNVVRSAVLQVLEKVKGLKDPDTKVVAEMFLPVQKKLKLKYMQIAEIETDPGPEPAPVPEQEGDND